MKVLDINTGSESIFKATGIVLLACSGLLFAEFLTRKAPLYYKKLLVILK